MNYRLREKAEQRHKSARFNRFLGRIQKTEESEDGTITAVICRDETKRPSGRTGTEGAYVEACREAKVAIVPVLVPKSHDQERGMAQVEAMMGGMNLNQDMEKDDFIGYGAAAAAYGRRSVDYCEKTLAARASAMQTG